MTNLRGPVVVAMDGVGEDTTSIFATLDLAAREAVRRHVDLRLVYGLRALPHWTLACVAFDREVARIAAAHPTLAITTALYPGTAGQALTRAAVAASLVVLVAVAGSDRAEAIADLLATTTVAHAPIIVVMTPAPTTAPVEQREPAFAN